MRHFLLHWQRRRALTWNLSKQLWDEQRHKALVCFLCCGFISGCSFLTLLMYWFHRLLWQALHLLGVKQKIYYYSVNFFKLCFKGFYFGLLHYSVILPRMFFPVIFSRSKFSLLKLCVFLWVVSLFSLAFFSLWSTLGSVHLHWNSISCL